MKSVLLVGNKEERFLIRSLIKNPENFHILQTFDEALDFLKKSPEPAPSVIVDERLELRFSPLSAVQQAAKPTPSTLEIIEEFREMGVITENTLLAVLMAEGRNPAQSLIYSEVGADLVLARPLGGQEIRTHFDSFFKWIASPPASLTMRHSLRALVEAQKYEEAVQKIEKFLELDGKNLSMRILLARALVSQSSKESVLAGIKKLKELDGEYPQSVLTKSLLMSAHEKIGSLPEAAIFSLSLFKTETNAPNMILLFETLQKYLAIADRSQARVVIAKILKAMSDVFIERNRMSLRFLIAQFFSKISETLPGIEGIEIFSREIPRLYPKTDRDFYPFKKDILPPVSGHLSRWSQSEDSKVENLNPGQHQAIFDVCLNVLELDLNNSEATSFFVETGLLLGKADAVWSLLSPTSEQILSGKKIGLVTITSLVRVALELGLLKEASDMIHQGRRHFPGNEKLDELSARWKEIFTAKNS